MSKAELLSQEELGFLLTDYEFDGEARVANDPWSVEDVDAVTLRGDLIDTRFEDLLRSVAAEQGVLRLTNPIEEHFLYVERGRVQDLVVRRHKARRMGQRLVAAGQLTEEQLEEALKIHKRDGHPLGKVLISQGFVRQDVVAQLIDDQAVEDLYSLFTWSVGQYQFRPGPPAPEHVDQFDALPRFDIERVLQEVAVRREEWDRILCSPEGLDGVIRPLRAAAVRLPAAHASILRVLDGEQSVRELAEATMLGLFECARAVKDLYDWKMVETAEPAQLLTIARSRLVQGETKRAAMILQSLWNRLDPTDHEFAGELADALQRCGENRLAARCLLRAAEHAEFAQDRLELAQRAYGADSRSLDVLTYYRDRLLEAGAEERQVAEVACAMTDALARDQKFEEALDVIRPFAAPRHDSVVAFGRKVRLLCRLGCPQEAVTELLELARDYRESGDHHRETAVYQHVLRIDPDRKDLAARLEALRPKRKRRAPLFAVAGVVAAAAAIGWWLHDRHGASERLRALSARVVELLEQGDADGALAALDADEEHAGDPVTDGLRARAIGILHDRAEQKRLARSALLSEFALAAVHMEAGRPSSALQIYGQLLQQPEQREETLHVARIRLGELSRRLEERAKSGELRLPGPPDPLADVDQLRSRLEALERDFAVDGLAEASGVLAARDHPVLLECLGDEAVARMASAAEEVVRTFSAAEELKRDYRRRLGERYEQTRLAPLAIAAQKHEESFRFHDALEEYRALVRDFPDQEDPVLDRFVARRDRCAAIVEVLDNLAQATERGDSRTSRALLQMLKKREPSVPFDDLVELPLRVVTVPAGARVSVNGVEAGAAPLVCRYRPGDDTHIEASLVGFETRHTTLQGDPADVLRMVLPRVPDWSAETPGIVQARSASKAPGPPAQQPVIFIADRSGTLTAVDSFGTQVWSFRTRDLNGLLPAPLVLDHRVVLASLDGKVRCLDATTADVSWEARDLPCEAAPVLAGGRVFVATLDRRLVALDPATGDALAAAQLPGKAASDLVASEDRVFATTVDGWLACVNASSGAIEWRLRLGTRCFTPACLAGDLVVGVSGEGRAVAAQQASGTVVWERHGIGEVELAPVHAGGHVFLAHDNRLTSLRVADGARGPSYRGTERWSVAPTVAGERLLIGDRQGTVAVFDTEKLHLLYTLRGRAPVSAPVSATPAGFLACFEDRSVQFFRELP